MKRNYVRPIFIAEAYSFNESFAKDCTYKVDPNEPLNIYFGSYACYDEKEGATDSGHKAGDGKIPASAYSNDGINPATGLPGKYLTIFNDGDSNDCTYDWFGPGKSVIGPAPAREDYGIFQKAISGAGADNPNHRPAYNGAEMYS